MNPLKVVKGDSVGIAQDSQLYTFIDNKLYYSHNAKKMIPGIYLEQYDLNHSMSKIIIEDKIYFAYNEDLREFKNDKTGKATNYHGTNAVCW